MLSGGELPVRVFKRARTLQLYDEGKSSPECAEALGIGEETALRAAKKYLEGGLDLAPYETPRPGAERKIDQKARSSNRCHDLFESPRRLFTLVPESDREGSHKPRLCRVYKRRDYSSTSSSP